MKSRSAITLKRRLLKKLRIWVKDSKKNGREARKEREETSDWAYHHRMDAVAASYEAKERMFSKLIQDIQKL